MIKEITHNQWSEYRYLLDQELVEKLIVRVDDKEFVWATYTNALGKFFAPFNEDVLECLEEDEGVLILVYKQTAIYPIKDLIEPMAINNLAFPQLEIQVYTQLEKQLGFGRRDELATQFVVVYKILSEITTKQIPLDISLFYFCLFV